ncbi:hypothetical protein OQA88_3207 [Cercophora sp. LCS_1]
MYILKALRLAKEGESEDARVAREEKLHERLFRCYLHDAQFDKARGILEKVSDDNLKASLRRAMKMISSWGADNADHHRKLVLDRMPRFKAHLDDVAESYTIGHDQVESLFDNDLEKSCSAQDSVSLMFCGSGDARNIYETIYDISRRERAAIARALIFFDMAVMYVTLKVHKPPPQGIEDAPTIMAYLFASQIIPPEVNEKLQAHIAGLISTLETDDDQVFSWLFVPPHTRHEVVYILRRWKKPDTARYYTTPVVRRGVKARQDLVKRNMPAAFGPMDGDPKGFQKERKWYDDLAALLPSKQFAERRDLPLVSLMENYQRGSKDALGQLADHIDANWATNWTLIDFDHMQDNLELPDALVELPPGVDPDVAKAPPIDEDSLRIAAALLRQPGSSGGIGALQSVANFFESVAVAVVTLSPRLKIEAFTGEMADTLDQIRWGCLEARAEPAGGIDPSTFPRFYDRIHMSNIPD